MTRCSGVVQSFDAEEGLGAIELDDGSTIGFHATELADGTRRVDPGTTVTVSIVAWHAGRIEATEIEVVGPPVLGPC